MIILAWLPIVLLAILPIVTLGVILTNGGSFKESLAVGLIAVGRIVVFFAFIVWVVWGIKYIGAH